MVIIIVVLPLLIVKGCDFKSDDVAPIKEGEVIIKVYIKTEDIVKEMSLEEYLKGVVAAEMPAEFEVEALKAQAVAARTYALRLEKLNSPQEDLHKGADICSTVHCQVWISKTEAKKRWGFFTATKNWGKIENAVEDTKNIIVTYNNTIANTLFHSNSGGNTENAEDVWAGVEVPYLKSVVSDGEDSSSEFKNTVLLNINDFYGKLKDKYPDIKLDKENILKDIKVLDYTVGKRVKNIKIGGVALKGTEVRSLFALKSANFKIEKSDQDTLKITTLGNGHGVGMSQWGATAMAKSGKNFEEILKYYYTGVELNSVESLESATDIGQ